MNINVKVLLVFHMETKQNTTKERKIRRILDARNAYGIVCGHMEIYFLLFIFPASPNKSSRIESKNHQPKDPQSSFMIILIQVKSSR